MIVFFEIPDSSVLAVEINVEPASDIVDKLIWLTGNARYLGKKEINQTFVGPRKEMITPWSTNAVEITINMGISGISRMEIFLNEKSRPLFDPMLHQKYPKLDQSIFNINKQPEPLKYIEQISQYNQEEGLALSSDEINFLESLSIKIGRKLTDSEIFGFSQVNSEHCRHKIFNGTFIIDGQEMSSSLFQLIRKTTSTNPNRVISAYKDNCAFVKGPDIIQFSPINPDKPDYFKLKMFPSVISLKAETHNFPTTVEPFNGAATGSGGEIRDRIAGGKGSFPIAGTAVYMTSYPRTSQERTWEKHQVPRQWLYQTPEEILIKASNGASDFGNKYGQPLICGSLFTFEHSENNKKYGYDKVIMLAGGIGQANLKDAEKDKPAVGDQVVLLGGDNYRIGMGGGAVSSVATGEFSNKIELNAVQRSNPEMQKRVYNAIRALAELDHNPIVSIHDHGAGGHLNCLSELVETTGGVIDISKLPVGDPTLSEKEIIGNESQERMGLVMKKEHVPLLESIAERERAPMYVIGETTGDLKFVFNNPVKGNKPIDLLLEDMFGNSPKTIMEDSTKKINFQDVVYQIDIFNEYLDEILQLEQVACKDWLTNKVDRSVTGRIATQQTAGPLQLPLNNLGVVSADYSSFKGIATSIGHSPVAALISPSAGSRLAISEALTNLVWTPIEQGIKGVSLSANWMWPCKNPGEDAALFEAVQSASDFSIALGINIPTGKDSLSMTQKYPDGSVVYSPGTVIISTVAESKDIRKTISPVVIDNLQSKLYYIPFSQSGFELGGSSFSQLIGSIGNKTPDIENPDYFLKAFEYIQQLVDRELLLSGHDISSGGLIVTLLEMFFSNPGLGASISFDSFEEKDLVKVLFSETPGVVIQVDDFVSVNSLANELNINVFELGAVEKSELLTIMHRGSKIEIEIKEKLEKWFQSSFLLDSKQCGLQKASERKNNFQKHKLKYQFPSHFKGLLNHLGLNTGLRPESGLKAAIIREKGVNGDREMAWMMYLSGLDVKDVHMTDLISGRETLEDIRLIVFVGGFSNSDVLGSAKGWAGAFLYNEKARMALDRFYSRSDTLSLGVCNGCQLMIELGLITPTHEIKPKMLHNESGKFESGFINVIVTENKTVMLHSLSGSTLGVWVAHGEGKFSFPKPEKDYHVALKYAHDSYPANPNGSDYSVAGISSEDGRHLAIIPHPERAIYPWNWPWYEPTRPNDEVSPWIEIFVNAREWLKKNIHVV